MKTYPDFASVPEGARCCPNKKDGQFNFQHMPKELWRKTEEMSWDGEWLVSSDPAMEDLCIRLKVPESGNPEIDRLITESRRWDIAQAALSKDPIFGTELATALIEKLKGGKG